MVKAERGLIIDRNGSTIVGNAPSYNLYIVKEDAPSLHILVKKLEQLLPALNVERALERIKKSFIYEPALVYRGLTMDNMSYLLEHIDEYRGIKIDVDTNRHYKDGLAYSHIIGYMGEALENDIKEKGYHLGELKGKTGIEVFYEDVLKGRNGAIQAEVNNYGLINRILSEKTSIKGDDLILNVDAELQLLVSHLFEGKKGSAVVLDIRDGSIISLYSSPSYNLDDFIPFISIDKWKDLSSDKNKPLSNRAIEGGYPPGSVFKVIMAYAALDDKKVSIRDNFYCAGIFNFGPLKFHCWKEGGHGYVDLRRALVESCDIYFYNLGLILGIDSLSRHAQNLGFGEISGIDLLNEKKGVFPSRQWKKSVLKTSWYPGETINTSIGQGYIVATPLQVAVSYATIFNGGYLYEPRLAKGIGSSVNFVRFQPKLKKKVSISPYIIKFLLEALEGVVNEPYGTGYRAKAMNFKVGGKTGTSQVASMKKTKDLKESEIPEKLRDHSWFAAIFPTDEPIYVAVALVEHGGAGSKSAASVVGAIANIMQDLGYVKK
jgi:penicillin-binding protein 2